MGRVIAILLCFGLIGAYEFPRIWRRRQQEKFEVWIYGGLFVVTAAYCVAFLLNAPLPDPNGLIRKLFSGIGDKLMEPATGA